MMQVTIRACSHADLPRHAVPGVEREKSFSHGNLIAAAVFTRPWPK
jgi:hypothetical protein